MYNVSDAYKAAIAQSSRQFELGGEIRLKNGEVIPITDNTVWDKGDVEIDTRAMSADDETDIGACCAATLDMTIVDDNSEHLYADAEIELVCSLLLENGEKEAIPMGTFYVGANTAKRTGKRFALTAYDAMIKLQYLLTDDMRAALKGLTGYRAAAYLYEGEMAQDEETVAAFPNGDLTLDFSSEQIETARDAVMWIGHLMGCFSRIDRLGRLEFVQLQPRNWAVTEDGKHFTIYPEREILANQRFKTEYSDKRQQIFTLIMRDKTGKPVYYRLNSEGTKTTHISYETESNPLVLSQTSRSVYDVIKNIVSGSLGYMTIQPFRSEIANDPALEAGDYVTIKSGGDNDSASFNSMITHNIWRYRGHHEVRSGASMQTVSFDAPVAAAFSARAKARARETTAEKTYVQPISQSDKAARNQSAGAGSSDRLTAPDGSMWVANYSGSLTHYDADGNLVGTISLNGYRSGPYQATVDFGQTSTTRYRQIKVVGNTSDGVTMFAEIGDLRFDITSGNPSDGKRPSIVFSSENGSVGLELWAGNIYYVETSGGTTTRKRVRFV